MTTHLESFRMASLWIVTVSTIAPRTTPEAEKIKSRLEKQFLFLIIFVESSSLNHFTSFCIGLPPELCPRADCEAL